jgi:dihydrofolate reductase
VPVTRRHGGGCGHEGSHRDREPDALLLGRVTFEDMRGYWPRQTDDTTGSMTLVSDLIAAGLVDEYRLFMYPVVLGHGRRLFVDTHVPKLRLAESRQFRSGIVLLRYQTA